MEIDDASSLSDATLAELTALLLRKDRKVHAEAVGERFVDVYRAAGYQALGPKGYMGTIFYAPEGMHPVGRAVLMVIMTPVELIGKLAKPFALAVRLFANMTAGHMVILALLGLIITYGSFAAPIGVTAVIGPLAMGLFVMLLEVLIAFIQAYIFAALTAVFIGLIRHH